MTQLTPAMRRAAILITTLDERSADALLDQMSEDDARKVRHAVLELGEIDPAEQEAVIAAFLGRPQGKAPVPSSSDVEFVLSPAAAAARPQPQSPASDVTPFGFLHDAPPRTLAKYLHREHPQTAAVVLAHLPPERAAAVLAELPSTLQTEVLVRIGQFAEMDGEIVREVATGLESALRHELAAVRKRGSGVAALSAILSAAGPQRASLLHQVAMQDDQLAYQLGHISANQEEVHRPAKVMSFRMQESPPLASRRVSNAGTNSPSPAATPAIEFMQLMALDDRAWAKILAAAEPAIGLLALAGAPAELMERLLKQLPQREARILEAKVEQLGPVRLRDIEQAQQQLARIAMQLASRGELRLPRPKSFATAA